MKDEGGRMKDEGCNRESLPHGWTIAGIYEICEVLDGMRVPVNEKERAQRLANARHRFPYFGATGQVGEIDNYIFDGESVLLGEDGAPFLDPWKPKAYLVNGQYWVNNHAHILRADQSVSAGFVCHQLNTIDYRAFVSGTTRLKLTQASMRDIRLLLPPANEQHRIVSKIDELFSRISEGEQALQRVEKLVERYRQSVLKAAVTGELTRDWREARRRSGEPLESGETLLARILAARRAAWEAAELEKLKARGKTPTDERWKQKYKEPQPPDTTELSELPEGWVWASGAQLFEWSSGDFLPAKAMRSGAYPVYGGNGINGTHNHWNVERPTLVIGRVGAHCGNVYRTRNKCWITDNAIFATRVPQFGSLAFLELCLTSAKLRNQAQGGAQPFINQKALNEVIFPIPSVTEQDAIVDIVEIELGKLLALTMVCNEQGVRSAALRQSILNAAFSGQLVPQDPDDEPASKLLERIAAERAAAPTGTGRRGRRARSQV